MDKTYFGLSEDMIKGLAKNLGIEDTEGKSPEEIMQLLMEMDKKLSKNVSEKKKKSKPHTLSHEDVEKIIARSYELLPPRPAVRFTLKKGKPDIFDCKIGGVPYFPVDMEYPHNPINDKEPLYLLAQINFEKIPHIENFPEKGILQFYISAADGEYGIGYEYPKQYGFRVIYHSDIITDRSKLMTEKELKKEGILPLRKLDEYALPIHTEYLLDVTGTEPVYPTSWDNRYNSALIAAYKEITGKNAYIKDTILRFDQDEDFIYDCLSETEKALRGDNENCPAEAFIGGYPCFTQCDPRSEDDGTDRLDTVLFELDSIYRNDVSVEWGDCGTGAFLISSEDLRALDFSKVLYNYDCC